VNAYIEIDFALAVRVMMLLDSGELQQAMQKPVDTEVEEKKFTSQNKMRLVPTAVKMEFFAKADGNWANELGSLNKQQLNGIFCVVLNVEENSAVWHKTISLFLAKCMEVYKNEAWHAFTGVWKADLHDEYAELIEQFGYFRLIKSDVPNEHYAKIIHISGESVELDAEHRIRKWEVRDNMCFKRACLIDEVYTLYLADFFRFKNIILKAPIYLQEVPLHEFYDGMPVPLTGDGGAV